ncbi:hypothetical protein AAMO2058_001516100 [Amorphochlora amoebiformis]
MDVSWGCPSAKVAFWRGSFSKACMRVGSHPYNQRVEFFCPSSEYGKASADEKSTDLAKQFGVQFGLQNAYTYRMHASPDVYIQEGLRDYFVEKKGGGMDVEGGGGEGGRDRATCAVALSEGGGNVLGVDNGVLRMRIDGQSREILGLDAQRSTVEKVDRFVINLDLNVKSLRDTKKGNESDRRRRIKWCLSRMAPSSFTVTSPYALSFPKGISVSRIEPEVYFKHIEAAKIPPFEAWTDTWPDSAEEAGIMANQIADFFGMVSIGIVDPSFQPPPSFIAKITRKNQPSQTEKKPLSQETSPKSSSRMSIAGIRNAVHVNTVQDCMKTLNRKVHSGTLPWAGLSLIGFEHAPVSWNGKEHGNIGHGGGGGEHNTIVIILPKDVCWVIYLVGSKDKAR